MKMRKIEISIRGKRKGPGEKSFELKDASHINNPSKNLWVK